MFSKTNKLLKNSLCGMALLPMLFSLNSAFAALDLNSETSQQYLNTAKVEAKLGVLSHKKADIILRIPSQQAYGFPGEAQTPEQKTAVDNAVDNLKQNIGTIVAVDPALNCKYEINDVDKFSTAKVEYQKKLESENKKVTSEYKVLKVDVTLNCAKDLNNQTLNLNLSQNFKNIDKIIVDLKSKQKRKFVIDKSTGSFNF